MGRRLGQWFACWLGLALCLSLPSIAAFDLSIGLKTAAAGSVLVLALLGVFARYWIVRHWSRTIGPVTPVILDGLSKKRLVEVPSAKIDCCVLRGLLTGPVVVISRGMLLKHRDQLQNHLDRDHGSIIGTIGIWLSLVLEKRFATRSGYGWTPLRVFGSSFFYPTFVFIKKIGLYTERMC